MYLMFTYVLLIISIWKRYGAVFIETVTDKCYLYNMLETWSICEVNQRLSSIFLFVLTASNGIWKTALVVFEFRISCCIREQWFTTLELLKIIVVFGLFCYSLIFTSLSLLAKSFSFRCLNIQWTSSSLSTITTITLTDMTTPSGTLVKMNGRQPSYELTTLDGTRTFTAGARSIVFDI